MFLFLSLLLFFVFFLSRKMYPNLKENLEQFRMHLKESAREMAPLKVWQLQGTGITMYQESVSH